ncbi:hypothetical protein ACQKKG_10310 [Brevundimonas sp. NPDC003935]
MTTTRTRATTIRMAIVIVMGMDMTTAIRMGSAGTIMDRWTPATGAMLSA